MLSRVVHAVCLGIACVIATPVVHAEEKPTLQSPVVHDDGRVTIAIKAPKATNVVLSSGELTRVVGADALKMSRDDDGVWSATFGPVAPGIYDYSFNVDGVRVTDPLSKNVFGNRTGSRGYLEVPGPKGSPRIDEWRDVAARRRHATLVQVVGDRHDAKRACLHAAGLFNFDRTEIDNAAGALSAARLRRRRSSLVATRPGERHRRQSAWRRGNASRC